MAVNAKIIPVVDHELEVQMPDYPFGSSADSNTVLVSRCPECAPARAGSDK